MVGSLIETLTHAGISFIVAPYEADAQLAYLARSNKAFFFFFNLP